MTDVELPGRVQPTPCRDISATSSLHDWERTAKVKIGDTWLVHVRCRACGVQGIRPEGCP